MKASELRQSILQAAAQGKLVPQDVHNEPASELLKRIQAEKAKLIKDGKLKKEKPLPPISEDEIPYGLPEGWVWGQLDQVCMGVFDCPHSTPTYTNKDTEFLCLRTKELKPGVIEWNKLHFLSQDQYIERTKRYIPKYGDIVYAREGKFGVAAIIDKKVPLALGQRLMVFSINHELISNKYLFYALISDICLMQAKRKQLGMTAQHVNVNDIIRLLLPIPPLAEQQRIVAKVDELMALCDELEAAEQELDELESRFTEYLPKSILQAAVQGKLVPQNMHAEPATALLERINAEKIRLVKEGKLKKEKPLPSITEDEIPYDLPDGWIWCRLGDIIIQNIGGGTPSKQNPAYWNGNIPWASVKDLSSAFLSKTKDKITELGLMESSSNLIPANSIIVCTRMGLGKITTNVIPVAINQDLRALIISDANINSQYVIQYYNTLNIKGDGTTVKGITVEELHNIPFLLPPLAEQQRIVAKVDKLMALCNELKAVKASSIEKADMASRGVIEFPKTKPEELLQLAARGEISEKPSAEFMQAVDDMFKGDV